MKTFVCAGFLTAILSSSATFASLPVPLLNPLAAFKKGRVHFDCRELAQTNGLGQNLMRFDLVLEAPRIDSGTGVILEQYPLAMEKAELGTMGGGGPTPITKGYYALAMNLDRSNEHAFGQILFTKTKFERLMFTADEEKPMSGQWAGMREHQHINLSQDIESKLVMVRYKREIIMDDGAPNCRQTGLCYPRVHVPSDDVMVCEPTK